MVSLPRLTADQLRFSYEEGKEVLRGVDLKLFRGELTALVGNNGAGKTTLLRLLSGLLKPSSGSIQSDLDQGESRADMGALLGQPLCWRTLTVQRWLDSFASFYPSFDKAWQSELLHRLSLDPATKVQTLSSGNLQKLHLVRALQHQPSLLLLDEPTSRLDPETRKVFWPLMRDVAASGVAVLISSHQIEELELSVNRFLLLENGKISEEIATTSDERGWRIVLNSSLEKVLAAIGEIKSAMLNSFQRNGQTYLDWPATVDRREVLTRIIEAGITPYQLGATPLFERWEKKE